MIHLFTILYSIIPHIQNTSDHNNHNNLFFNDVAINVDNEVTYPVTLGDFQKRHQEKKCSFTNINVYYPWENKGYSIGQIVQNNDLPIVIFRKMLLKWLLKLGSSKEIEILQIGLIYFTSCTMKKHYFLLWTKETAFFPYFHHEIIFYSAELFDCAVNYIFQHKNKSNIEGAIFELRSSHLFRNQPCKEILEFKCQIALVFYPSRAFLRILVTFFRPVLCRICHNLNCNKFAIIKNKNLTKILKVVKFSSI